MDESSSQYNAAIVPLYDFGEHEGQSYLVMRFMPGGSLADRLNRDRLPMAEIVNITERVCSALDKAHALGVVHRDLKPGNILFDAEGNAFLADFGIARVVEDTQTMTIIGTPRYMSPEQAHGEPVDARTDVYQMGVCLFEMITGQVPFDATTAIAVLHKHVYAPVPSVTEKNPEVPASVERVVKQALAKNKEDRFATAGKLAEDLKAALLLPEQKLLEHESRSGDREQDATTLLLYEKLPGEQDAATLLLSENLPQPRKWPSCSSEGPGY